MSEGAKMRQVVLGYAWGVPKGVMGCKGVPRVLECLRGVLRVRGGGSRIKEMSSNPGSLYSSSLEAWPQDLNGH